MMKTFSVVASSLLGLVLMAPLGCATAAPDPEPEPESSERSEREVRAELFDELQRAGTLAPECTKGDFVCCACHGGPICCAPQ